MTFPQCLGKSFPQIVAVEFATFQGIDGGFPAALVLDGAGNFFGTTFSGGAPKSSCSCGTVFGLSPSASEGWQKTVLYSFNDGLDGGSFACPESGCGGVYRLAPESSGWRFGVVYTFNPSTASRDRAAASPRAD